MAGRKRAADDAAAAMEAEDDDDEGSVGRLHDPPHDGVDDDKAWTTESGQKRQGPLGLDANEARTLEWLNQPLVP